MPPNPPTLDPSPISRRVPASRSTTGDEHDDAAGPGPTAAQIATSAYGLYLEHGSLPGDDLHHWFTAESALLARHRPPAGNRPGLR